MKCECQLCGEIKEIFCCSPENKETTFKLFGISGSNLPICQPCMIKKHQNPEFMINLNQIVSGIKKWLNSYGFSKICACESCVEETGLEFKSGYVE